jgi:hypothetical protein
MQRHVTQREWLTEDLAQIRRYFPGAKVMEPLDTPFDIKPAARTRTQRGRYERTARVVAEKAAGRVQAAHEPQRYAHPKRSELFLENGCISYGGLL